MCEENHIVKRAIIMAAGFGNRMYPLTLTTPKPLVKVNGVRMIDTVVDGLRSNGITEIYVVAAVEITKFSERDNGVVDVDATIYCEKASHKGIIIGKQGAMLKKISTAAREDAERFMGTKVFLQTWVKVKENWRDSDFLLRNFGYE